METKTIKNLSAKKDLWNDTKAFNEMMETYFRMFPIDQILSGRTSAEARIEVYKMASLKRIADALEIIAQKGK